MDTSGKLTPAGQLLAANWADYQKNRSRENLDKVTACMKERMAEFTPDDKELFEKLEVEVKLLDPHASPLMQHITPVTGLLRATPAGASPIDQLPAELIKELLSYNFSLADLQILYNVSRSFREQVTIQLADKINRSALKLRPPGKLLTLLHICGAHVRTLNLWQILKTAPTGKELKEILGKCPNLKRLVVDRLFSLPKDPSTPSAAAEGFPRMGFPQAQNFANGGFLARFAALGPIQPLKRAFPSTELEDLLMKHFIEFPDSLTHFFGDLLNFGHDYFEELREICPNLQRAESLPRGHFARASWLSKGKDFFEYVNLRDKIEPIQQKLKGDANAHKLLNKVPPDWFLSLSEGRRAFILKHAKSLFRLEGLLLDKFETLLDEFVTLPDTLQDNLLTNMKERGVTRKIKSGATLVQILEFIAHRNEEKLKAQMEPSD